MQIFALFFRIICYTAFQGCDDAILEVVQPFCVWRFVTRFWIKINDWKEKEKTAES
jgi:hypothetical protein